jgi:two-component system, response regulator
MIDDGPVQILLVEDNPIDAELTIRVLEKTHVADRIEHVLDGAEALDFLFCRNKYADRNPSTGPDLIFLDLQLPKLNGLEVLAQIKKDARTKSIPVVVLTSSEGDREFVESYMLGADTYIQKPITSEALLDITRNLKSNHSV